MASLGALCVCRMDRTDPGQITLLAGLMGHAGHDCLRLSLHQKISRSLEDRVCDSQVPTGQMTAIAVALGSGLFLSYLPAYLLRAKKFTGAGLIGTAWG